MQLDQCVPDALIAYVDFDSVTARLREDAVRQPKDEPSELKATLEAEKRRLSFDDPARLLTGILRKPDQLNRDRHLSESIR